MFFLTPLSVFFSLGNAVFKYSPERMEGDQLVTRGVGAQELKERRNKLPERILTSYRSTPVSPTNLAILTNITDFLSWARIVPDTRNMEFNKTVFGGSQTSCSTMIYRNSCY